MPARELNPQHALISRIELAESYNAVELTMARRRWFGDIIVDWDWTSGACLTFAGHWSHLSQGIGLGVWSAADGDVLSRAESFFYGYRALPTFHIAADQGPTPDDLQRRGYRFLGSHTVVSLPSLQSAPGAISHVSEVLSDDAIDQWIEVAAEGFRNRPPTDRGEREPGGVVACMSGAKLFGAFSSGALSGVGALSMNAGIAVLFCDATLAQARGLGLHSELIRARVAAAWRAGCDYAVALVAAGSQSHRNYLSIGFRDTYTRCTWQRDFD